MAEEGLKAGSVYVDFVINNNDAQAKLKDIDKSLNQIAISSKSLSNEASKSFKKVESETKSLSSEIDSLKNSFSVLKSAIIGAFAFESVKGLIQLGANLEQTELSFQVMLKSADKAKNLLKELNTFANFTPFSNEEVIQTAKTLLSFGFSVEQINNSLKSLGDVASGTGQRLQDVAVIFGQINLAGKLTAQELMQLVNRGVPILKVLADQLNISESEVKDLITAGQITSEMVANAFKQMSSESGIFANMMMKQSETLGGKISTLTGTFDSLISKIGYLIGQAFIPLINIAINIVSYFDKIITTAKEFYDSLSETDKNIFKFIGAIIILTTTILTFLPVIKTLLIPSLISISYTITNVIVPAIKTFFATLGPLGITISGIVFVIALMTIKFQDWKNVIEPVLNLIKRLWSELANSAIIKTAIDLFNKFTSIFSTKNKEIKEASNSLNLLTIALRSIASILSIIVLNAITSIRVLIEMGRVGVESISFIINSLKVLVDKISRLELKNIGESLKNEFSEFAENLAEKVENFQGIFKDYSTTFAETIEQIFAKTEEKQDGLMQKSQENIEMTQNAIIKAEAQLNRLNVNVIGAGDIITNTIANVFNDLINIINAFLESTDERLKNFSISFLNLFNIFSKNANTAFDSSQVENFTKGFANFIQFLNGSLHAIGSYIQAFQTLKNITEQVFQNMAKWVSFLYDKQLQILENFFEEQKESFKQELEDYKSHLDNLRNAYENHINEMKLLNNEQYLNAKKNLELQYEEQKRRDAEEFERRKQLLQKSSVDSEQYYVNLQILREDFARIQEEREREFNEALKSLQDEFKQKEIEDTINYNAQLLQEAGVFNEQQWSLMSEREQMNAYLNYLKELELQKEQEINNKQIEEEKKYKDERKKIEKEKMMTEYIAQLHAFNIQKLMQILQLRIQMITSIVQIWSGLLSGFAAIPFGLGIPIAIALASGLSAMVGGMFTQAIGMVSAMPPPPPPAGLQSGGIIDSPVKKTGDYIPAMLADGEAVINRERTNKLFDFIDKQELKESQKNININFSPNSIYIAGVIDESLINQLSNRITTRIQTELRL